MQAVSAASSHAASWTRFEQLGSEDGLPQGQGYWVYQDSLGFMWFATGDGLARFDGQELKVFRHQRNDPESLADNSVTAVLEGSQGYMWIGTRNGLSRLHPASGRITNFRHDDSDPDSISHNDVRSIVEDADGRLWIATYGGGLDRLDRSTGRFVHHRHDPENPDSPGSNRVFNILPAPDGTLWLAVLGSGLDRFDPGTGDFVHYRPDPEDSTSLSHKDVWDLHLDNQGRLWVGTDRGLDRLREEGGFVHFRHDPNDPRSLSHNVVNAVVEDHEGMLWVGTNDGLNRLDPENGKFRRFNHDPGNPDGLSDDIIWSLFVDREGSLWVGTYYGGINRLTPLALQFENFSSTLSHSGSLSHDTIYGIHRDETGNLYVATHGGGLDVKPAGQSDFINHQNDPLDPHSLSNDIVWDVSDAAGGKIWVSTYGGGLNRFDPESGRFEHFRHDPSDPDSISHDDVRQVLRDSHGDIWVSTRAGLNRFDPDDETFERFQHDPEDPNSLSHDWTNRIIEDRDGQIWVGTYSGVNRFNRETGTFTRFQHDPEDPTSLAGNRVVEVYEDSRDHIWAGVIDGGLNRLIRETGEWLHFGTSDGLPDDTVVSIREDSQGYLWLGTESGMSRFNPDAETFINFRTSDGLGGNIFNSFGVHQDKDGTLYFGNRHGLTTFNPNSVSERIRDHMNQPDAFVTSLEVFGDEIEPKSEGPGSTLDRTLPYAEKMVLSPGQSVFTLGFAAPNYIHSSRLRYSYRLSGFDEDWHVTDTHRPYATYTNLDPGQYQFQVRAGIGNKWSNHVDKLQVTVLPPWWRTWWAYAIYLTSALLLVAWFVIHHRRNLSYEREVNLRLKEADRTKDEFLANTSHELRTPIHGVIGIAESLRDGISGELPEAARQHLAMIMGSGRRLSTLIDDILDFSQLRSRTLRLNRRAVDLHSVVQTVLDLTQPLVGDRNLELVNAVPTKMQALDADEDRLSQILHNLVGNAVKFTPEGRITISARPMDESAEIQVTDTGIGIPESQKDSVFYAFQQGHGGRTRPYPGSGLGLAITRQLVELHGGRISVDSAPGRGSTFTFTMPISGQPARIEPSTRESIAQPIGEQSIPETVMSRAEPARHKVLVIDDDTVNRKVLVNYLMLAGYATLEARGGQQALDMTAADYPDLILLDLTMPGQSGIDVCRTLRQQYSLMELPVIFITADHRQNEMTAGFQAGANDYLTKPVARDELLARVRLHLQLMDAHRNLESTVQRRTRELEDKNRKLEETRRSLEEASLTDPLTGLRNRRFLVRFIENDVHVAVRSAKDRKASRSSQSEDLVFFVMDLDDFKGVNDRYGHQAGDEVLVQIRDLLSSVFRGSDYLVRWGGEEFLGVARFVERGSAPELAERLRHSLAQQPFQTSKKETLHMTWSIGFAAFPFLQDHPKTLTWAQVISIADLALYSVKRLGGNGWMGFHPGRVANSDTLFGRFLDDAADLVDSGELRVESSYRVINPLKRESS